MDPEAKLRLVDVSLTLGEVKAVNHLSFAVMPGETVALLGPSGSGKSTVIRLIIGLVRPDEGEIWVAGTEISRLGERGLQKVRRHLGVVFQEQSLFTSLTVGENVGYCLAEEKDHQKDLDRMVRDQLSFVGLSGFEGRMPSELSGGQARRVAIARAIACKPNIMLYDEPMSGLDPVTAWEVTQNLVRVSKTGVTSLIVTHQLEYALAIAQRTILIRGGSLIFDGTPRELERVQDDYVQAYLASARRLAQELMHNL